MRKTLIAGAVALGAVGATVGVTAAQADDGTRALPERTFTVVEHAITDTTTDTGAKGDTVGDVLTFANPVYGPKNAIKVGRDNGTCIRTRAGHTYQCSWTTVLRGGSLVVEGPFYDARDSVLAITGGTGRFAKAQGEMRLHARNAAGSAYDFTFTLR